MFPVYEHWWNRCGIHAWSFLNHEFIMKTPISSTAIDDMPKPKAMELAALNAFRAKSKRKLDPLKEMPGPGYRWSREEKRLLEEMRNARTWL